MDGIEIFGLSILFLFPGTICFLCIVVWWKNGKLKNLICYLFASIFLILFRYGLFGTSLPMLAYLALCSSIGFTFFVFFNRHLSPYGFPLRLIGTLLNLFSVTMNNGKMPVLDLAFQDSLHVLMDNSTKFNILGDWIPLAGWYASIGDIVVSIGSFVLLFEFIQSRQSLTVK